MKDSGIEWIGLIPASWRINTVFQVFTQVKRKNINQLEKNLLSLSYGKIKRKNIDTTEGLLPESFDNYNIIEANDIVLRLTDLQNDQNSLRVGIAEEKGIVTSAYITIRNKSSASSKYLYYFLHSFDVAKGFYGMGAGVRQGLTWDGVKWLKLLVPSHEEQTRIADFLDKKVSEIDAVISKTKESIEEYKKLKQSIITEAVTKGLDPNVEMKDSGNKFVGLIPKHWEIKRTRFIADSLEKGNGITKEEVYPDGDISCVRYGEIYTKYNGAFTSCVSRTKLEQIGKPSYFSHGDLLFCGTGELVEEIGKNIVYLGNEKCLAGGDIIVMKHRQDPTFINYALNSGYSQTQKSYGKAKLKVVHISTSEIGNVWIALPPMEEQKKIGEYLDGQCSKYDNLISKKEQVITELEQYKKSLIYEYVTGKKEVA